MPSVDFDNTVVSLDDALAQLIRRCHGLRSFQVIADVSTAFVANICELRRREEVSLEKFHVTCYEASMTKVSDLRRIREHYVAMMNAERIDYAFDTTEEVMEEN